MSTTAAVAAAGGIAFGAYLNAKYQLGKELSMVMKMVRTRRDIQQRTAAHRLSPFYLLDEVATRRPRERAIWTRTRTWTFLQMRDEVLQYAQYLIEQGIQPGDVVALYLQNSGEFVLLVFAAFCIGATTAMINWSSQGSAMLHCLAIAKAKLLVVDSDVGCVERVSACQSSISSMETKIVILDDDFAQGITSSPVKDPGEHLRANMGPDFPLFLIYTSGTTGLPKACPLPLSRIVLIGAHLTPLFGTKPGSDCWYCPMPLYHGTGMASCLYALLSGTSIALAPVFSVSKFWPDVHESNSTVFVYVGEVARYLLAAPDHPLERSHRLRLCVGNGLRPDVWQQLQDRFGVAEVAEFFSSTEGVFSLVVWARNEYLRGCVGHHGGILRRIFSNVYVPVLVDIETGDIWRDPQTGFAKRTPYAEGGEILVKVPNREAFVGYRDNEEATQKRFVTDVFARGDLFYRSGDSLRRTADGHWFFIDRLGDSYRWKSENISTAEVATVLGEMSNIQEANVYGVEVPGHEGRAGCAALTLAPGMDITDVDFGQLYTLAHQRMTRAGIPVFLRIAKHRYHGSNFKQQKQTLRREGVAPKDLGSIDPQGANDILYWAAPGHSSYLPFLQRDWDRLQAGDAKL